MILSGTADATGAKFLYEVVKNFVAASNTDGAGVRKYIRESLRLRALGFWRDD